MYDPSIAQALSAIQLLCLHLALKRFAATGEAIDGEDFVPYIRSLPQDFSTVPLWQEVIGNEAWLQIANDDRLVPYGLMAAIEDVSKRFWKDWKRTSGIWVCCSSDR